MLDSRIRYPGAQPFSDDDLSRKTFFGRDRESVDLTNKILANRLVVVYAKSGLGKTSLLNAGVAPLLRDENCLPLIVRVNDVQRGPFTSVVDGIRAAAERQEEVEYASGRLDSFWHFFKTTEFWRGDLLLTPVLILDQFEELFTLQSVESRAAFLSNLGALVRGVRPPAPLQTDKNGAASEGPRSELTDTPPAIRIVLSLREDYLSFLEEAADWIPQILNHRFRLTALPTEAAAEALTGPARIADNAFQTKPFSYDPEAVKTIISHLSQRSAQRIAHTARYVEPFQLQLICQRIEGIVAQRQKGTDTALTVTMRDIGGEAALKATLRGFYKQEILALPRRRQRRAVRRLCEEYLISPEGRRLSLEENEIRRQLKLPSETLIKLVDRRLLRSDQRADSTYYELSHDTLVEPVLATRRMAGRSLGSLTVIVGALFLLIGGLGALGLSITLYQDIFGSGIEVPEHLRGVDPEIYKQGIRSQAILGLIFGLPLFLFFGVIAFRRGIRTFRRYRSLRGKIKATVTGGPRGLGGWLILPAIGLFVLPIRLTIMLINDFLPIFQRGYWEALTTPGSEAYHHLWAPLVIFEIAGNTFFIIFDIILIFLFFTKSYRFPVLFIAFLVLNLFFVVSDFFFADLIPAVAAESDREFVRDLAGSIIGAIIWIPYFLVSKRVKNTFVKPESNRVAGGV